MQHASATVFLFDIDGTLLLTGGAGRRAFERAFAEVTGVADAVNGFAFGGMTDRAIARQGLVQLGREVSPAVVDELIAHYLVALEDEIAHTPKFTIMPGVPALIADLAVQPGVVLGLGTGNVRRGAEVKLRRAGLWASFSFGGFGCDHELRAELLLSGAERGAALLGRAREECRVVVIGDTVRDVAAAHAIGAECIAVETGGIAANVLRAAGAHAVYRDLLDDGVRARLLGA